MTSQDTKPLISVIVPIFRVEKYLEKCVSSILAQTYGNIEIILVDDGSDDGCPAICDRFQAADSRVKVLHNENGGLSKARNCGLKIATGDFIGFVDSDDWLEPNMYEVLMSALQETGANIAFCNYQMESEGAKPFPLVAGTSKIELFSSEEALRRLITSKGFVHYFVWNKLYRRSVVSNLIFPEGRSFEDCLWTPQAIDNAKSIACVDLPLYHYLIRNKGITRCADNYVLKFMDRMELSEQRIQFIIDNYPSLAKLAIAEFQILVLRQYVRIGAKYSQLDSDGEKRRLIHSHYRKYSLFSTLCVDSVIASFLRLLF